jgi:hypothetical protein
MEPAAVLAIVSAEPWSTIRGSRLRAWGAVSVGIQRFLRRASFETFSLGLDRFQDCSVAYPLIVYSVSRMFFPGTVEQWTRDLSDRACVNTATSKIGLPLCGRLSEIQELLTAAGTVINGAYFQELARLRYAPYWAEDILRSVKRHPKPLLAILAREALLIEAIVGLDAGHRNRAAALQVCARLEASCCRSLRNFHGMDLRHLLPEILAVASQALATARALASPASPAPTASNPPRPA